MPGVEGPSGIAERAKAMRYDWGGLIRTGRGERRALEVLNLLGEGKTQAMVAREMGLTQPAISYYLRIMHNVLKGPLPKDHPLADSRIQTLLSRSSRRREV
jgi:hypothetical protein